MHNEDQKKNEEDIRRELQIEFQTAAMYSVRMLVEWKKIISETEF
jgi:hypothetical protein